MIRKVGLGTMIRDVGLGTMIRSRSGNNDQRSRFQNRYARVFTRQGWNFAHNVK